MLKRTTNTNNSGIRFYKQIIAPKLQKCWIHKIAFNIISKMLKQPNYPYSQPSTPPKEALAKFYLSTTFGSSFMIRSVAPTRSSTSYAYFITKIWNHNLNAIKLLWHFCHYLDSAHLSYDQNTVHNTKIQLVMWNLLLLRK